MAQKPPLLKVMGSVKWRHHAGSSDSQTGCFESSFWFSTIQFWVNNLPWTLKWQPSSGLCFLWSLLYSCTVNHNPNVWCLSVFKWIVIGFCFHLSFSDLMMAGVSGCFRSKGWLKNDLFVMTSGDLHSCLLEFGHPWLNNNATDHNKLAS